MKTVQLEPWIVTQSKEILNVPPWIRIVRQQVTLPDGRIIDDYHQVTFPDFAVAVVQNEAGEFILARQYRQGIGKISLLLPGGQINLGEKPLDAVKRELFEETGYIAKNWQSLGCFVVNANYGCGRAHVFTANNARQLQPPNSGDLEEVELLFLTRNQLLCALQNGDIAALGVAAAISLALLLNH